MKNNIVKLLSVCILFTLFSHTLFAQRKSMVKSFVTKTDTTHLNLNIGFSNTMKKKFNIPANYTFELSNQKNTTLKSSESGYTYSRYIQKYNGIKIEHSDIIVHSVGDKITFINADYIDVPAIDLSVVLTQASARAKAKEHINAQVYLEDNAATLSWFTNNVRTGEYPYTELVICKNRLNAQDTSFHLAYKIEICAIKPLSWDYVYVDAKNGQILYKNSLIRYADGTANTRYSGWQVISTTLANSSLSNNYTAPINPRPAYSSGHYLYDTSRGNGIATYDMKDQYLFPEGLKAYYNSNPSNVWTYSNSDNAALDAHWGAMVTYDYFSKVHGRNSHDDKGGILINYVNVNLRDIFGSANNCNAVWFGGVMIYGKGETNCQPLTSLDIVAHEIAHGICNNSVGLIPWGEPGAINESLSDIWAACVEHYCIQHYNDDAQPKNPWLMGEEVGHIIRSMSNPNDYGQPDTYKSDDYWVDTETGDDFGGIHTNCGVMNFWFYLLSNGGTDFNDKGHQYQVDPIGIEKAAKIVYLAETSCFKSETDYQNARESTIHVTESLFGKNSYEVASVINAWYAVGVSDTTARCTTVITDREFTNSDLINSCCDVEMSNITIESPGAQVLVTSSSRIHLLPGIHVKAGCNFFAMIEDCGASAAPSLRSAEGFNTEANRDITLEEEIKAENIPGIEIYPNPTTGIVNIAVSGNAEIRAINVFNISGKLLKRNMDFSSNTLDLSDLDNGTYFLKISSANQTKTEKIIINK